MYFRWIVSYCVVCSLTAASLATAEEPAAKLPAEKPTATSPELLEFLQKWEAASPQGEVVDIQFEVYVYDDIFFTEQRGLGRFVYRNPNQGGFKVKPMPIKSGEKSKRKDPKGRPYKLDGIRSEMWYWDGKFINQIDTKEKSYRRIRLPEKINLMPDEVGTPEFSWPLFIPWQILSNPKEMLPMVADIDAEQLLNDYDWFRGKANSKGLRLIARPKAARLRQEYKQIEVLLDKDSLRTHATRIIRPTGQSQTVSVIKNVETDPAQIGDWRPNLKGYKLINNH